MRFSQSEIDEAISILRKIPSDDEDPGFDLVTLAQLAKGEVEEAHKRIKKLKDMSRKEIEDGLKVAHDKVDYAEYIFEKIYSFCPEENLDEIGESGLHHPCKLCGCMSGTKEIKVETWVRCDSCGHRPDEAKR